jgi:hypothetical protein
MISMTRREFDGVAAALTDAWLEARRRERLARLGLREKVANKAAINTNAKAAARAVDTATQH